MISIKYVLLLALLLAFPVNAAVENYNSASFLDIEVKISAEIYASPTSSSSEISFIKADLNYFPINTFRQTVMKTTFDSVPEAIAKKDTDSIAFTWTEPTSKELRYSLTSKVRVSNNFFEIKSKSIFPVRKIPGEFFEYTKATEFIDINGEIEAKAREIIGPISLDEDLYEIVFKIADWTKNNIEYSLNTLTAEVDQKSSWVLKNRYGVCDEITNLFISFIRSLGIPARFVSGVIYSNIDYKFSNHGWAEVYFPDYGWVPFDVTLGQYGWLSPDHVRLKDDVDSGTPAVFYSWSAEGIKIDISKINIETKVEEVGIPIASPVEISTYTLEDKVKFGSYVPLAVVVTNKKDLYVSTQVAVTKAPGLVEKNVREILLKPKETKIIYWTLKIQDGLRADYSYTSDIEISDVYGNKAFSKITYDAASKFIAKSDAEAQISNLLSKEDKNNFICTGDGQASCLNFDCELNKPFYYENETADVNCKLKASQDIYDINFCVSDHCSSYSLNKDEVKDITIKIDAHESGRLLISAETKDSIEYKYLPIKVLMIPNIFFSDVNPEAVEYNRLQKVSFIINTNTEIYDVDLDFGVGHLYFDQLTSKGEVMLKIPSHKILRGIPVKITYKDEEGKKYEHEDKIFIKVNNVPWYINILASLGLI
ncbi:MAG TPA: transglutaminase-like domain-containing protein [Candidatus Nanoarchaeia archaeon]|nr:transglutaminase-like domain-containing protein [Candidatus Nanoarchaeia archaeon]